jgi:hypothetical protein
MKRFTFIPIPSDDVTKLKEYNLGLTMSNGCVIFYSDNTIDEIKMVMNTAGCTTLSINSLKEE